MSCPADARDLDRRIGKQRRIVDSRIGQLVDEAAVCAVLEQPPDEIREQVAVPTDRRVAAAGVALVADQPLVQSIAHAVEPLELESAAV